MDLTTITCDTVDNLGCTFPLQHTNFKLKQLPERHACFPRNSNGASNHGLSLSFLIFPNGCSPTHSSSQCSYSYNSAPICCPHEGRTPDAMAGFLGLQWTPIVA